MVAYRVIAMNRKTIKHFSEVGFLMATVVVASWLFATPFAAAQPAALSAHGSAAPAFYVSTAGDDSNPGTLQAPWRTIQHAADVATVGSTVNVRGGVYEERVSINV